MNAKDWLRHNEYHEILSSIAHIEARWKAQGKGTRRSWWDVLSGRKNGEPYRVEGIVFPVLKSAQIRLGKDVTSNATSKRGEVPPPPKVQQARWGKICPEQEQDSTCTDRR